MKAVYAQRPVPPHATRQQWRTLLDGARTLARGDIDRAKGAVAMIDFEHLATRARATEFPVEGASVAFMVEAFLRQARAFCVVINPELKELFGAPLLASADCLEEMLDAQRRAEAVRGRRCLGERED